MTKNDGRQIAIVLKNKNVTFRPPQTIAESCDNCPSQHPYRKERDK
jgi:hypothetical protein